MLADHLSDLPDASAAERCIIRRAVVLTVELERLEVQFALAGEATQPRWIFIGAQREIFGACSKQLGCSAGRGTSARRSPTSFVKIGSGSHDHAPVEM